jgi:DnaJ-class molecular chaperone
MEDNDLCKDCNGTGLQDNFHLCPTCKGTPSKAERDKLAETSEVEAKSNTSVETKPSE